MSELNTRIELYTGKTLKKQGERTGNNGEVIEWKLWNLLFDVGGNYPWKCGAFNSLSDKGIQIKDLEEGNYYEVVYKENEYNHPQYGAQKSRTVVLIKNSTKEAKEAFDAKQVSVKPKLNAVNWADFAAEYNEAVAGEGNPLHMLGVYVANNHAKDFASIIELCKNNF